MIQTIKRIKHFLIILTTTVLVACGGGDGISGASVETATGVFVDAPVQGLDYQSGEQAGVTDANGTFTYEVGREVIFLVGDGIEIGSADGASVITPVDLVSGAEDETNAIVTNIIRFLQTLDDDNDLSNGILITEAMQEFADSSFPIDFEQSVEDFANDTEVQTLVNELTTLSNAGARDLRSVEAAREHFRDSLLGLLEGTYTGTYEGDSSGSWGFVVSSEGEIAGIGLDDLEDEAFSIFGTLSSDGSLTASGTADISTWVGTINDDTINGTWESTDGDNGTFTGQAGGTLPTTDGGNQSGTQ